MKHVGLHVYRFKGNPDEKRFAEAWEAINQGSHGTLNCLLGDGQHPVKASDREAVVAATVVQWLGSPVGKVWLENLGYKKGPRKSMGGEKRPA